jgi:hypothetical protein
MRNRQRQRGTVEMYAYRKLDEVEVEQGGVSHGRPARPPSETLARQTRPHRR